jgi:hypothetical protein
MERKAKIKVGKKEGRKEGRWTVRWVGGRMHVMD